MIKEVTKMIGKFFAMFFPKKTYNIQTFTFFIPSPPARNSGYREKQFDKVFYDFINAGYEVISFNTVPCTSSSQSGMWVVCLVRATNKEASELSLDNLLHDQINSSKNNEKIDGLYYINNSKDYENL